jgi:hypothetical protein
VRAVDRLAQIAPREVLQRGHQRRLVEREPPRTAFGRGVGLARGARGLRGELERARRQAGDLLRCAQGERPRLRRVEHVVREARLHLGELGQDRVEALFLFALEGDTGEHRVAHEHVHDAPLRGLERRELGGLLQRNERLVERPALRETDPEANHLGLHRLVRASQRRVVLHAEQVTDDAPARAQPVGDPLQRLDRAGPGRCDVALQCLELALEIGDERPHTRLDVLRADLREARQAALVEERIGGRGLAVHQKRMVYETSVPGSSGRATSSIQLRSVASRSSGRRAKTGPDSSRGVSAPSGT